jgi:hypothetical protein
VGTVLIGRPGKVQQALSLDPTHPRSPGGTKYYVTQMLNRRKLRQVWCLQSLTLASAHFFNTIIMMKMALRIEVVI